MVLLIIVAGLVGAGLWVVFIYNRFVRNRNRVDEAWSGIDVQLKRRTDLIPNLVETVKGYAGHEQHTLQELTALRATVGRGDNVGARGAVEAQIGHALGRLLAVAEAYPDLKANENFRALQTELAGVEDQIQYARRYYNGATRVLNILVESFPSNLIARQFGFTKAEYFELQSPTERTVPAVSFAG